MAAPSDRVENALLPRVRMLPTLVMTCTSSRYRRVAPLSLSTTISSSMQVQRSRCKSAADDASEVFCCPAPAQLLSVMVASACKSSEILLVQLVGESHTSSSTVQAGRVVL